MPSRLRFQEAPESSVWLEVDLDGSWTVAYRLEATGGRIVFGEMKVSQRRSSSRGVDASLLRRIPVGEHRQLVDQHIDQLRERYGDVLLAPKGLLGRHGLAEVVQAAKQRRAPRDARYFAQLAARYVELLEAGVTRPTPIIAEELDRPRSYVTNAIRDARKMGLLTPTTHGRAGGRLTPKARRLLKQTDQAHRTGKGK